MLSKKTRAFAFYISTILLALFLVQCSYFFDEKEKSIEVNYTEKTGSCIGEANQVLEIYFSNNESADVTDDQLDDVEKCYSDALYAFSTHTKSGRLESDDFSAENIHLLLVKLHPEVQVSVETIEKFLEIKSFMIGGAIDGVSKKELQDLMSLIPDFTKLLKGVRPYRRILFGQADLDRDRQSYDLFHKSFEDGEIELTQFLVQMDKFSGDRRMSIERLASILISEFFGAESQSEYAKYLPLLKAFKNLVVDNSNTSDDQLDRQSLTYVFRQAYRTWKALDQFEYFIKQNRKGDIFTNIGGVATFFTLIPNQIVDSSIFKTIALNSIVDIVEDAETILNYSVRQRAQNNLKIETVIHLFEALETAKILGESLSADTLGYFLSEFSLKWMNPGVETGTELDSTKLRYVKNMLLKWVERQQVVNTLFENSSGNEVSFTKLESPLANHKITKWWREQLEKVATHQWDKMNRVFYSKNMRDFEYDELTVSNSIMLLAEVFMKPYNLNTGPVEKFVVTSDQTQEIYEVLRILGVELAFMDSRVFDSGHRTFIESNNFSTQLHNDQYMDFYEVYEYLTVAISSGELADKIYDDIPNHCHLDYADVHGRLVTNYDCFKNHLYNGFADYFSHHRAISKFWSQADDLDKQKFLGSLEYASRAGVISDKTYTLDEIRTLVTVLYYLEATFYNFDHNRDGVASGQELVFAEEHFHSMIEDIILTENRQMVVDSQGVLKKACDPPNQTIEDLASCLTPKVFVFLLNNGSIPEGSVSKAKFFPLLINYFENRTFSNTNATPRDVLRVFSTLGKLNHEGHLTDIKKFLTDHHNALFNDLSREQAPNCRERKDLVFCRWARVIYCNETVNPYLYSYMRDNKYSLFPEKAWEDDPERALIDTMSALNFSLRAHQKFSSQCAFPLFEDKDWVETVGEKAGDVLIGDPEDAGPGEKLIEFWKSLWEE